jgi:hypothetical protein
VVVRHPRRRDQLVEAAQRLVGARVVAALSVLRGLPRQSGVAEPVDSREHRGDDLLGGEVQSPAEPTAKPPLLSGRSLLDGIAAEEHACELHPARMLLDDAGPNGTLSASLIRDRSGPPVWQSGEDLKI